MVFVSDTGVSITGVSVEVTGSPCSCKGSDWMDLYGVYIFILIKGQSDDCSVSVKVSIAIVVVIVL